PEGVGGRARGEHQVVVRDVPARGGVEDLGVEVAADHLGGGEADPAVAADDAADGVGDVGGLEPRGGDLVQQRLEEVVVAPVEHLDGERGAAQLAGEGDAAEPGSDHDDTG